MRRQREEKVGSTAGLQSATVAVQSLRTYQSATTSLLETYRAKMETKIREHADAKDVLQRDLLLARSKLAETAAKFEDTQVQVEALSAQVEERDGLLLEEQEKVRRESAYSYCILHVVLCLVSRVGPLAFVMLL
jgi:hypothetical protein